MDNINDISKVNTWDEYKTYVKDVDPEAKADLEEAEQLVSVETTPKLSTLLKVLHPLGLTLNISTVSK